jgi:methionine-rich copper-binding protein CopC
MNRIVAAVAVLVGAIAVQAVAAAPVSAHATLTSATPADGAMLAAPPDVVELVFSESVARPAALVVLGPDGDEVDGGQLDVVGDTMRRSYDPASFVPGVYTVSYQVTSADAHPVSGSLSFMVHGEGDSTATLPASVNGGSGDSTDADPLVVASMVVVLAAALGVALFVTRRIVQQSDVDPAR